jgi:hypothetical protein
MADLREILPNCIFQGVKVLNLRLRIGRWGCWLIQKSRDHSKRKILLIRKTQLNKYLKLCQGKFKG